MRGAIEIVNARSVVLFVLTGSSCHVEVNKMALGMALDNTKRSPFDTMMVLLFLPAFAHIVPILRPLQTPRCKAKVWYVLTQKT